MIQNEIIEPTYSPWNSVSSKKDNTMKFVCDYRKLNKVTKKNAYLFPNIQDVIDRMRTTPDAASANWSMPSAGEDGKKTAFSVPLRQYKDRG